MWRNRRTFNAGNCFGGRSFGARSYLLAFDQPEKSRCAVGSKISALELCEMSRSSLFAASNSFVAVSDRADEKFDLVGPADSAVASRYRCRIWRIQFGGYFGGCICVPVALCAS